jgi:hypothetical protein
MVERVDILSSSLNTQPLGVNEVLYLHLPNLVSAKIRRTKPM